MAPQRLHQRGAIRIGTDGDAQELIDALGLEVTHDDAVATQRHRQGGRVMLRMTREDEVGRRRQDLKPRPSSCATRAVRLAMTMPQVFWK